jgi:hypothetical protein
MSDPKDDFRSTEDSIRRDADRLKALEDRKAASDPDDPHVVELSAEVERVTAGMSDKAAAERELSEQIQAEK